jgi:hypothetical protein
MSKVIARNAERPWELTCRSRKFCTGAHPEARPRKRTSVSLESSQRRSVFLAGLTDLMFRTSGATALIVILLLAVGGLLVLWRIWNRSRNVSARTPRHRSTRLPKTKLGSLMASQPTLSNSLVVMLAYVVVLSLAGVLVTGLTMAGVVLVSFAVLAAAGAFAAFRFRQN